MSTSSNYCQTIVGYPSVIRELVGVGLSISQGERPQKKSTLPIP